jgi:hypothetical protein
LKDFDVKEKVKKKRYEIRKFREDIIRQNDVRQQIAKVERNSNTRNRAQTLHK